MKLCGEWLVRCGGVVCSEVIRPFSSSRSGGNSHPHGPGPDPQAATEAHPSAEVQHFSRGIYLVHFLITKNMFHRCKFGRVDFSYNSSLNFLITKGGQMDSECIYICCILLYLTLLEKS